jgi:hypothetical protein
MKVHLAMAIKRPEIAPPIINGMHYYYKSLNFGILVNSGGNIQLIRKGLSEYGHFLT